MKIATPRIPTREKPWVAVSERYPTVEEFFEQPLAVIRLSSEYPEQLTICEADDPCEWRDFVKEQTPTHWTYARLLMPEELGAEITFPPAPPEKGT